MAQNGMKLSLCSYSALPPAERREKTSSTGGGWSVECTRQYHLKSYDHFTLIALKMALPSTPIAGGGVFGASLAVNIRAERRRSQHTFGHLCSASLQKVCGMKENWVFSVKF